MESEEGIVGASDLYSVYQMGFEKSSDLQLEVHSSATLRELRGYGTLNRNGPHRLIDLNA